MEKSAIEHLQGTSGLEQVIEQMVETDPYCPMIAVPNGISIKDISEFMPHRANYRFNFKTQSLNDFIRYCADQDGNNPLMIVEACGPLMSAQCTFDLGSTEMPLHQLHTALLRMKPRHDYRILLDAAGSKLSQKDMADFIMDNRHMIEVTSSSLDTISHEAASQLIREITIDKANQLTSSVDSFSGELSVSEKIEARNKPKLPAFLKFGIVPYQGMDEYVFELSISIDLTSERPQFHLRATNLERLQEIIADQFCAELLRQLEDSEITIYQGEI